MKRTVIRILDHAGSFAEDKDVARSLRQNQLTSALDQNVPVTIDFHGVDLATPSFVHALLAEVIRGRGPDVLDVLEFRGCNKTIQGLVTIVAEYTQQTSEPLAEDTPTPRTRRHK